MINTWNTINCLVESYPSGNDLPWLPDLFPKVYLRSNYRKKAASGQLFVNSSEHLII